MIVRHLSIKSSRFWTFFYTKDSYCNSAVPNIYPLWNLSLVLPESVSCGRIAAMSLHSPSVWLHPPSLAAADWSLVLFECHAQTAPRGEGEYIHIITSSHCCCISTVVVVVVVVVVVAVVVVAVVVLTLGAGPVLGCVCADALWYSCCVAFSL